MEAEKFTQGIRIKTKPELGSTAGMLVGVNLLIHRTPNKFGTLIQVIPGHGGDVWGVLHEDGTKAIYTHEECILDRDAGRNAAILMEDWVKLLAVVREFQDATTWGTPKGAEKMTKAKEHAASLLSELESWR